MRAITLAEINRRFGGGEAVYKETRISSKAPKIWVVDRNTLTVTGTIPLPAGEGHQIAVIK